MFTQVRLAPNRSHADAAALITEYLAFDRQRRRSRPYVQAFTGLATLVLLGGAIGRVPRIESIEAAALLFAPVGAILMLNTWRWWRLQGRLGMLRADIRASDS